MEKITYKHTEFIDLIEECLEDSLACGPIFSKKPLFNDYNFKFYLNTKLKKNIHNINKRGYSNVRLLRETIRDIVDYLNRKTIDYDTWKYYFDMEVAECINLLREEKRIKYREEKLIRLLKNKI